MSDLKPMEEGFSEIIPNSEGIPVQEADSLKIQKEHTRWREEIQQIKKEKAIKGQSNLESINSWTAL